MSQRHLTPSVPGGVYCNRTLNLRAVAAIGYDMDYTLIQYDARAWEERAFQHLRQRLADQGWPVADLRFDPDMVIRGLIIDRELGNIVKANRFGYVKLAAHGTAMLDFDAQRRTYSRVVVDLAEPRWVFLNTLFSLSEAAMFAQLVERLDARQLPQVMGYGDLYDHMRRTLDAAHLEGELKAQIVSEPERYVELDPGVPLALLDQRAAGKRLLLITNSDWPYTRFMMGYAFDRYLPAGTSWRDLFDLVIVSARKPEFFDGSAPIFHVVDDEGLLRPAPGGLSGTGVYLGGNAGQVETHLGLDSSDLLFVGDHVYADVHVTKEVRRWRTALIVRELDDEVAANRGFTERQAELAELMAAKGALERQYARARLAQLRGRSDYDPGAAGISGVADAMGELRARVAALDERIAPLAQASAELCNRRWGLVMRAGNDKSLLARQVENHADIYCARVSDFVDATPFAYFRSPRGSLPHDPCDMPDPGTGPA